MFVGMLWPWLMLACLRYLPISRWFRAGAACFVTALYIWLAPWAVDAIITANGWISSVPTTAAAVRRGFHRLGERAALGGNIMVTVMLVLTAAAAACLITGFRQKNSRREGPADTQ